MDDTLGQSTGSSTAVTPSLVSTWLVGIKFKVLEPSKRKENGDSGKFSYLKFPSIKPTVIFPCREYPTENSHLLRYPFTSGDASIPSKLHGRPPAAFVKYDIRLVISYSSMKYNEIKCKKKKSLKMNSQEYQINSQANLDDSLAFH